MRHILEEIILNKKADIAKRKSIYSLKSLLELESQFARNLNFAKALNNTKTNIIAEVKKASPSGGLIRENFNPIEIAKSYHKYGASCLSILTEEKYFLGSDDYVKQISKQVPLPILRKDFTVDAYQVHESKAIGADCILLIIAILDINVAKELEAIALEKKLSVLVEVHNIKELELALKYLNSPLIGINNRNLKTLKTDINTCIDLAKHIPPDKIIIAESGIKTAKEVQFIKKQGINNFLIGESLLREANVGVALGRLLDF